MTNPILERNLRSLAPGSGPAAQAVFRADPRPDVEFLDTEDGVPSALIGTGPQARQLASRRRPLDEAQRLAATIPIETTGGVAILGFGLGYHAQALIDRLKNTGLVIIFEPDVALLRAVLERVDHSAWLARGNVRVLTAADDQGAIAAALTGFEGVVALGARLLEHPASKARLGEAGSRFSTLFTGVMKAVRTNVVTTLVQMESTVGNLLMNLGHYAAADGIADLRVAARGKPAIVVSAGPSLRRNIDLLSRPGVRDRVVILAAQTVLKPLLAKGICPHFVTALDYHEISRRFYEGLTAADVEGVTLVVEPKANPAILDAYPGKIRCVADSVLDVVIGESLRRDMGELRAGATVAHLAYYLARHLGCDPVILIGQDLGFTDGQYYAAGAAIHQVWSSELNEFRTLEMLEWERIVRARHILRKTTDTLGRPVYADEQMATYLVQFERDFAADARAGLAIIDATEGGVAKKHTTVMTLAQALKTYADIDVEAVNDTAPAAATTPGAAIPLVEAFGAANRPAITREAVIARVKHLRSDVWRMEDLSRKSAAVLEKMLACHGDQSRVNRLITEVHGLRDEAVELGDAYFLVHHLNQTGTLKRYRADRALELDPTLPALEQQRRQIERDVENVRWLADSAAQMGRMLEDTVSALDGGPKVFRDPATDAPTTRTQASADATADELRIGPDHAPSQAAAIIIVDPDRSGLGTTRDLSCPIFNDDNALRLTLARLARCRTLDQVVLIAEDPARVHELVGRDLPAALASAGIQLTIHQTRIADRRARARSVGLSRLFAPACWRGAIGGLSIYDEAFDAAVVAPAMADLQLDTGVIVGADWSLVDPTLIDDCVQRHRERPTTNRLTFTQAPPGLAGCVVSRSLVTELAAARDNAGSFASIGGLLGYIPIAPQPDPIAKPSCITVPPLVRDLGVRCIPDSASRRAAIGDMMRALGDRSTAASAEDIARAITDGSSPSNSSFTDAGRHIVVELTTRRTSGWFPGSARAQWCDNASGSANADLSPSHLRDRLSTLRDGREDAVITFAGRGHPLAHPRWREAIAAAREAGFAAIHLRTDLAGNADDVEELIASGVDVISIDLFAASRDTYKHITGRDALETAAANTRALLARCTGAAARAGGLPSQWIIPRITRCDAVYEQIEAFYDRWLMEAGSCVIDPLPRAIPGERIEPLPLPASVAQRRADEILHVNPSDAADSAQATPPRPGIDLELKESPAEPRPRAA